MKSGPELVEFSNEIAVVKAKSNFVRLIVLGILAGAYIAFAGGAATMASYNLLASPDMFGLGRVLHGAVFTGGLIFCVIAGAELFTGNTLMAGAVAVKRISFGGMLRNWGIVYAANFVGSLLLVCMMNSSGLWNVSDGLLGAVAIKIAAGKTALGFEMGHIGINCADGEESIGSWCTTCAPPARVTGAG